MARNPPPCLICGRPLTVKKDKRGYVYLTCPERCINVFPATAAHRRTLTEMYTDATTKEPARPTEAKPSQEAGRTGAEPEPERRRGLTIDELYA